MLQLRSVFIFDNFAVLVSRLLLVFHTDFDYVINVIGIYIYIGFVVWGWVPGWWLRFYGGEPLCVEVPVTLVSIYLGMVTCFRARLCWGGGG